MSKKGKGILKFIIACGIVISAVCAVFAVLYRMQSKLKAVEADEEENDAGCDGNCSGCSICSDVVDEEVDEEEPVEDTDAEVDEA